MTVKLIHLNIDTNGVLLLIFNIPKLYKMKEYLLLTLVSSLIIISSCSENKKPESKIIGSWAVQEVARRSNNACQHWIIKKSENDFWIDVTARCNEAEPVKLSGKAMEHEGKIRLVLDEMYIELAYEPLKDVLLAYLANADYSEVKLWMTLERGEPTGQPKGEVHAR